MDHIVFTNTPRDAPYVAFPNYNPMPHTDVETFEDVTIDHLNELVVGLLHNMNIDMKFDGPTRYAYWLDSKNTEDAKERDDEFRVGIRASNGEFVLSSPCFEYFANGRNTVLQCKHYVKKGPHYATLENGKIINYRISAIIAGGIHVEYWQDHTGTIATILSRYSDVGNIIQNYVEGAANYYWHTPPGKSQAAYAGEVKWATYFPELANLEPSNTVQRAFLSAETAAAFVEKSKADIQHLCNFPPMPIDSIKRIIGS